MEYIISENEVYLLDKNEKKAFVTFPKVDEKIVIINKTYVREELRNMGIAGKLMELVAKELIRTNRKAILSCSYAIMFFNKNEKYRCLISE